MILPLMILGEKKRNGEKQSISWRSMSSQLQMGTIRSHMYHINSIQEEKY